MPVGDTVTVGCLRVRAPGGDAAAARLRAEAAVTRLDLHPTELGRHAVLVVRRLVWDGAEPAQGRERMAELARAALRPARGPVPPGAMAVLFADEAELLACLSADLVVGRTRELWWWARLPATSSLGAAWHERVQVLPAALAQLAPTVLRRAAAALAPVEVELILSELAASVGLPALDHPPAAGLAGPTSPTSAARAAPWSSWLPEDPALPLAPRAELLVGVALAVHHRAAARPAAFVDAARRWLHGVEAGARVPHTLAGAAATREGPVEPGPGRPLRPGLGRADPAAPSQAPTEVPAPSHGAEPIRSPRTPSGQEAPPILMSLPEAVPGGVGTRLGGVLYLVNALRRLQLFTTSPDLGGWAVLEGVARVLLAQDPHDRDPRDSVWATLAELDGREPDQRTGPVDIAPPLSPNPDGERGAGSVVGRWLAGAAASVAAHLEPAELPAGWLRVPGRIEAGRTHVDLVAPLAAIDVAVRRAGLDRDPGWVPELGRIVLFHFEDHG